MQETGVRLSRRCLLAIGMGKFAVRSAAAQAVAENADTPGVNVLVSYRSPDAARFRLLADNAALHAGDEVRIEIAAAALSYAYVFHRGASGLWALLFPNPEAAGDRAAANPLFPGDVCAVPGEHSRLVLNEMSGEEELIVYALARPDGAVDDLALRLRRGEHPPVRLDDSPKEGGVGLPPPKPSDDVPQGNPVAVELAMRGLTLTTLHEPGEIRLPVNYALRVAFRNLGLAGENRSN